MNLHDLTVIINGLWTLNLLANTVLAFARFHMTNTSIMTLATDASDEVKIHALSALTTVHADARAFSGLRKSAPAPGARSTLAPAVPSQGVALPQPEPP